MQITHLGKAFASQNSLSLAFFDCYVSADFPSPADEYVDRQLDLYQLLITHPWATFFVRVQGESMIGAGIMDGAILTVDRSLTPSEGKIVIAVVDNECTVKRIHYAPQAIHLVAENERYPPLIIPAEQLHRLDIWGVVTHAINPL